MAPVALPLAMSLDDGGVYRYYACRCRSLGDVCTYSYDALKCR